MAGSGPGRGYVGREVELDRLGRRLEAAAEGRGGFVVLSAQGGMGKTRTAHEVAARADRLGMVTLWGSAREGLAARPFGPLAEALEEFGRSIPPIDLRRLIGAGGPALARVCPRLREVVPDIPPAAPLEPVDERLRLYDGVVGWLTRAAAERPLLLVIDDLHWADDDTRDLLRRVVAAAPALPLLVLATADSEHASDDSAEVVDLPGLDEDALAAVLAGLADRPLPPAVSATIHAASGGHPLFARELYRHLAEEDRLAADRLPAADDLPPTLEAVVSWRLSRLTLETRNVLTALACFSAGAAPTLLAQIAGLSRSRLVEVVERGVAAELVRLADRGQRYAVYHDRIRQAVLAATPGRVKTAVHRRAAEAMEAEFGEEARTHAAELAEHIVQGGGDDPGSLLEGRSVRHLLVAAEQARTTGAYRRAATFMGHVVTAFGGGRREEYVELVARRALAEAEAGDVEAAVTSVRGLLAGQRRHGSLTREAWVDLARTIRTIRYAGDVSTAAALARAALEEGASRDELVKARLRIMAEEWQEAEAGGVGFRRWRDDETGAGELLVTRGDEADRGDLLAPQRLRDLPTSGRLTSAAASGHRPASVLRALLGATSDALTRFGQPRDASVLAGRYLAAAERAGSLRDIAHALLLLARARAALGDLDAASEIIEAADEVLARVPGQEALLTDRLLSQLVLAHYRDGDWGGMVGRLTEVRQGPAQAAGLWLAAEQALAEARAAKEPEARDLIGSVLNGVGDVPPLTFGRDQALYVALTAAWEVGAAEFSVLGRSLVERAAAAGAAGSHTATARLALARVHGLSGNIPEARDLFAGERAHLDGYGMRPLRAILDHDEAVTLAASGKHAADARALLSRATTEFDALGMTGWADRARWLLATGFEAAAEPGGRLHFSYPAGLSRREVDVVRLVAEGGTPATAAAQLEVDTSVVERHLASALQKLGASSVDELPRYARRYGLAGN